MPDHAAVHSSNQAEPAIVTGEQGGPRTAPPRATGSSRVELRELLRILNRRKAQLIGVVALVCVITGLILAYLTPEYRATALVLLDTRKVKVTNTTDVLSGMSTDVTAMQTEIEVLKSSELLGRVVDKLKLGEDTEFGAVPPGVFTQLVRGARQQMTGLIRSGDPAKEQQLDASPRARAIVALARALVVTPRGRSFVIGVSIDSVEPAKAKKIIEALTDYYVVDQLQAKLDANKRATEFFNERLDELKSKVEVSERAAAAFREKSGLTIGKDSTIASQSLSELNTQLVQARAQRADKESRLVALKEAARSPATLGGVTEVLANPLISSLRAQEAEVARRIGDLNQRYGDSHPRLLQARAEQGQIQARIGAEVSKILGSLQGDAEAAKSKEAELQAQVDRLEQKAGGLGQSEVQLRQLDREAQSSRAIYEDFLKRAKELREQQDIQQPDARILSPAAVAPQAVFPRYGLTMLLAIAIGLMLGTLLVALIERLDGGFRNGDQIERMTGHPLVGMIPGLSASTLGSLMPSQFAVEKPASAYSESLRSAYTAIMLGSLDRPPKVLMITSSLPGEGKSTFACSLSALLARSNPGKKIVIVDCDLRRTSVAKALGVPPGEGTIDEYLTGTKTLEQVIGREPNSGLYYVLAHRDTPSSTEILDSNAMRNFVRTLSETFDLVILDTPPLMAVSDTRVTAKVADYIVYLVQWEKTAREGVLNSLKELRGLHKPISIVLTQVNVRRHSRYGYGDYGYYYSKYRDYYTN